jgi:predicted alpha/beta hydrolase family esterase
MIVLSGTIKGVGCSKGGAFMSKFEEFESAVAETVSSAAIEAIDELDNANEIDPISNLKDRAVIIMSSENDPTVPPENQEAIF